MKQLTKIQRFRFSEETNEKLNQLSKFGIKKSTFVRQAVEDKLKNVTFAKKQTKCPF